MGLQLPAPPADGYDVLRQAITRLSTAGGAAAQATNVSDPSKLQAALPHEVYTLGSTDITQGRHLSRARLTSWRFLLQYGSKTIAAIELACDARGGKLRFASIDSGPLAQGTRDAVSHAEALNSVQAGSYELRVLKAPSVYVMALWLKNLEMGDDIVIPISTPAPAGAAHPSLVRRLESAGGAPLAQSPTDFIQGLRSAAVTSLRFDSRP